MKAEVSDQPMPNGPSEPFGPSSIATSQSGDSILPLIVLLLFFFLLGATFSGWYIIDAIQETQDRAALRANGRVIVGEVNDVTLGRGDKETVSYTFTVQGKTYHGRTRYSGSQGIFLAKSDHLSIRYLPSDPAINHPDAWEWSALLNLDQIIVGPFLMAVTTWAFIRIRRKRKLGPEAKPA
jgi:hypothetical protein